MEKKQKTLLFILGFAAAAGLGSAATYFANYRKIAFADRYPILLDAEKFVKETLEMPLPESSEQTEAKAYFTLFGDKYTEFIPGVDTDTAEYAVEKVNNSPSAKKSGYRIRFNDAGELYISAVVPGLGADRQGLRVGDIITNIDDMEVTKYRHAVRLTGDDGTVAKIKLIRDGKEMSLDFRREADMAEITGIKTELMGDVLYVAIRDFSHSVAEKFNSAIEKESFGKIIIDLRENGGGFSPEAVNVADNFIGASKVLFRARSGGEKSYETSPEIRFDVPVVVLINENTASAAEILTALLKQYGDAILVGTNTFGKGIYQEMGIYCGGNVKYTEGKVYVGDWDCYDGKGIAPDHDIDMDPDYIGTENDIQLEKALELLK